MKSNTIKNTFLGKTSVTPPCLSYVVGAHVHGQCTFVYKCGQSIGARVGGGEETPQNQNKQHQWGVWVLHRIARQPTGGVRERKMKWLLVDEGKLNNHNLIAFAEQAYLVLGVRGGALAGTIAGGVPTLLTRGRGTRTHSPPVHVAGMRGGSGVPREKPHRREEATQTPRRQAPRPACRDCFFFLINVVTVMLNETSLFEDLLYIWGHSIPKFTGETRKGKRTKVHVLLFSARGIQHVSLQDRWRGCVPAGVFPASQVTQRVKRPPASVGSETRLSNAVLVAVGLNKATQVLFYTSLLSREETSVQHELDMKWHADVCIYRWTLIWGNLDDNKPVIKKKKWKKRLCKIMRDA